MIRRTEQYEILGGPIRPAGQTSVQLPLLQDGSSIQLALQEVAQAVLDQRIDGRRGSLVLYALQTASNNLKQSNFDPEKVCITTPPPPKPAPQPLPSRGDPVVAALNGEAPTAPSEVDEPAPTPEFAFRPDPNEDNDPLKDDPAIQKIRRSRRMLEWEEQTVRQDRAKGREYEPPKEEDPAPWRPRSSPLP